ncbi:uncharacterized protein G2W53_011313 [Senna tora]|uniref:Uncharacterized protein n=1 Tax=Senna tora TaxID=362788 RepID=A0A834X1R3_9FABA|nr:uncharacterized protein G2W53_011313 [Senna tora]
MEGKKTKVRSCGAVRWKVTEGDRSRSILLLSLKCGHGKS